MEHIGIAKKLLLACLAAIILPLIILGSISIYRSSALMRNLQERQLKSIGTLLVDQLDLLINQQKDSLNNAPLYETSLKRIERALSLGTKLEDIAQIQLAINPTKFQDRNKYEFFLITDKHGKIVGGNSEDFSGKSDLQLKQLIDAALNGQTLVGGSTISHAASDGYITFAAPLSYSGAISGTIITGWKLKAINQAIQKPGLGENGYVFMFDDSGRIITSTKKLTSETKRNILQLNADWLSKPNIADRTGIIEFFDADSQFFVVFQSLQSANWQIGLMIPQSDVLKPISGIRTTLGFSILLIALTVSLITLFIVEKGVNLPVKNLIRSFETIASGQYEQPIDTSRGDELGRLAKSFAAMRDVIKTKINDYRRLIEIIESTSDLVLMSKPDGQIIYLNVAGKEMIGGEDNCSVPPKRFQDLFNHGQPDSNVTQILQQVNDKGIWVGESSLSNSMGEIIPISQVVMSHKNSQGDIEYYSAIIRDISVQKKSEQRLMDALSFNQKIIAESPIGISIFNSFGECIDANPAIVEIVGLDKKQLLETRFRSLDYWFDANMSLAAEEALEKNQNRRLESTIELNKKQEKSLDSFFVPFTSSGQQQLLVMTTDISKRIEYQKEIRQLRNFLKNIVDSMPSILIGINSDFKITEWNLEAQKLTGVLPNHALGEDLVEIFPRLKSQMPRIRQAVNGNEIVKSEKIPWEFDKKTMYSDLLIYPLIANGVSGAVIRIDDVTERTNLENIMIQTEKMITVGQAAAGMAHEINNPLGIIIQSAQNITRRLSPDLAKNLKSATKYEINLEKLQSYLKEREIPSFLDMIEESGERASSIIREMLNFSRKSDSVLVKTDLTNVLDNAVALVQRDYDLKQSYDFSHVKVIRDYDSDITEVPLIPNEFKQVIVNLLKNAFQAMLNDPSNKDPQIALRTFKNGEDINIRIQDNGPGIAEKHQKRIFDPFFTTKPTGKGTGLGLFVSYMIIKEKHNGTIDVDSQPGRGTTFQISLPS